MKRLTKPLLDAMHSALEAALAGDGFDGGDFEGENQDHFERAVEWIKQEKERRNAMKGKGTK